MLRMNSLAEYVVYKITLYSFADDGLQVHEASEILGDPERRRVRLSSVQLRIPLTPASRNTTSTIENFLNPVLNPPPVLPHRPFLCSDPTPSQLFAPQELDL